MVHRGLLVLIAAVAGPLGAAVAASAAISLRHDAQRAGLRVGMAAEPRYLDDAGFAPLLARQANAVTFENAAKWAAVHPSRHRYDFRGADRLALWARDHGLAVGSRARVRLLARDVSLARAPLTDTSIGNQLPGTVEEIAADEHEGLALVRVRVGGSPVVARLTRRSAHTLGLAPGMPVWAQVKTVALME